MRSLTSTAAAVFLFVSLPVRAQGDVEAEIEDTLATQDSGPAEERREEMQQIGDDQLAVFELQRGFYLSSDLGVLMTFGGTQGYSNLQPFLSLKAGFDFNDYLSVQAALSAGYSSGNPISENDLPGAGGRDIVDFSLTSAGVEIVAAIRPTERFAIEPKLGGGITTLSPAPTDPRDVEASVGSVLPHASAGVDLKYLTLLTDFTAGISLTGYFIVGPNIPAGAAAFVVRYTL
jgi:hypothetical protein